MFKRRTQAIANGDIAVIQRCSPQCDRQNDLIPPDSCIVAVNCREITEENKNQLYQISLAKDDNARAYSFDQLNVLVDQNFVFCCLPDGKQSYLIRRRSSATTIRVITTERKFLIALIGSDGAACEVMFYAKEIGEKTIVCNEDKLDIFLKRYSLSKKTDNEAMGEQTTDEQSSIMSELIAAPTTRGKSRKKVSRRAPAGCRR